MSPIRIRVALEGPAGALAACIVQGLLAGCAAAVVLGTVVLFVAAGA